MKKLGKLSINPERVMKNEELVNLRGGYGEYGYGDPCTCSCYDNDRKCGFGYIANDGSSTCDDLCNLIWQGSKGFCGNANPPMRAC